MSGITGGIKCQFDLGVVQSAEGSPIYHELFDGNVVEVSTLTTTLEEVMQCFQIRRVIAIADRGLLSIDFLKELEALKIPGIGSHESTIVVPGFRYNDFEELLSSFHKKHCLTAEEEIIGELKWEELPLVVAHDPFAAGEKTAARDLKIKQLEDAAEQWMAR